MKAKPNPEEVQCARSLLTENELKTVKKNNPFRNDRNEKILELRRRGLKLIVLSELTGLSATSLATITKHGYNKHR